MLPLGDLKTNENITHKDKKSNVRRSSPAGCEAAMLPLDVGSNPGGGIFVLFIGDSHVDIG